MLIYNYSKSNYKNKNGSGKKSVRFYSEGMGFEPTVELPPHDPSKIAPSTARTPLYILTILIITKHNPIVNILYLDDEN